MLRRNPIPVPNSASIEPKAASFAEGRTVYEEGEPSTCWYEVASGIARTCRYFPDGERHVLGFHFAGDVFGLARDLRDEAAEAVTELHLWKHAHRSVLDDAHEVNQVLEAALQRTRNCLYMLGQRTAEQRLATFLVDLADRPRDGIDVRIPMTRADIADHLRLTVHTVSRTLSSLSRRRLILLSGPQTFRMIDEPALRSLADRGAARERANGAHQD